MQAQSADGAIHEFPDGTDPSVVDRVMKQYAQTAQQPQSSDSDFWRSMPRGILGGLANQMSAGGQAAQIEMGQPVDVPSPQVTRQELEKNVTGQLYAPQGRSGHFGESVGEFVGSPASYIGPGSMGLKLGAAILGGLGSEAGGEVAGAPGRLAGALIGGAGAAKALGPAAAAKAAIPTADELFSVARQGYKQAANSGLELNPAGVGQFASAAKQELTNGPEFAFTGGAEGTAPKTFAALDKLQNIPDDAKITASNLDTLRRHLNDIASEVQPTATPGVSKSTADAVAAMALKERLFNYMENIPKDHIVAGDPQAYFDTIKTANGNWAAGSRLSNVDARLTRAENAADRQLVGSPESQIKSKIGSMLDNPQRLRGLTQEEIDQIQRINSGTPLSNALRQAGRLSPRLGTQGVVALATGGASIPAQLATLPFYGARKLSEAITTSRANKLADMLAQRSPEYQSRMNAVPPAPDQTDSRATLIRALLMGMTQ